MIKNQVTMITLSKSPLVTIFNLNGNVQSHDQKESILNITINANSDARTLTRDQITKKSIQ